MPTDDDQIDGINFFKSGFTAPIGSIGCTVKLSKNILWHSSLEYQFSPKYDKYGYRLENPKSNFAINSGLQFQFIKKTRPSYEYVK